MGIVLTVRKGKRMKINIETIKNKMKELGFTYEKVEPIGMPEGWTNTLVDAIEELYSIETELRKAFEND